MADVCISVAIAYWAFYLVYRFGYIDSKKESDYIQISISDLETNQPINNEKDNKNYVIAKNEKNKINLNFKTKALIYSFIIFSFISLLERSDYINLIISVMTVYYFIIDENGTIITYLKQFIWCLGGGHFYRFNLVKIWKFFC